MSMRLSRSIVGEAEAEAVRRVIVEDGYLGMRPACSNRNWPPIWAWRPNRW